MEWDIVAEQLVHPLASCFTAECLQIKNWPSSHLSDKSMNADTTCSGRPRRNGTKTSEQNTPLHNLVYTLLNVLMAENLPLKKNYLPAVICSHANFSELSFYPCMFFSQSFPHISFGHIFSKCDP